MNKNYLLVFGVIVAIFIIAINYFKITNVVKDNFSMGSIIRERRRDRANTKKQFIYLAKPIIDKKNKAF